MQQQSPYQAITLITPTAKMAADVHGGRAKCLQRLVRLDMPVPSTVALSFDQVLQIAKGRMPDMRDILKHFVDGMLLSIRPSSQSADWGGPTAILNIGMNPEKHAALCERIGEGPATRLYLHFVQSYAVHVHRLDPEFFEYPDLSDADALKAALAAFEDETDEPFPADPAVQLKEALRSMARAWDGTSARLLREAKGAPADAGLGLVVQAMVMALGEGECGAGRIQYVNSDTGTPQITGRYVPQSQRRRALMDDERAMYLTKDPRGRSLEEAAPDVFAELSALGDVCRRKLREEMMVEFTVESGVLWVLDAVRAPRASRAAVHIAVALAKDRIIPREEAVMRIQPTALTEMLHRQVDPDAPRDLVVRGIAASPGAASGQLVFTSQDAQACAARSEPCVLLRRETTPEDIRGMHAAQAVLTMRGGVTSHAAVIGRGLGLPCVVGASALKINSKRKSIRVPDGRVLTEGDIVTVDGTTGQVYLGSVETIEAALDESFQTLLSWADDVRDIGVRANADTPADAQTARNFAAEGIGLCRTEHMFFEGDRLGVMREMIFAETAEDRRAVLDRLMPMQRADFGALFDIMSGLPVCIRLFDPPLHEFLPADRAGVRDLAEQMALTQAEVQERIAGLTEHNPMLGMRGVRLGIAVPEIYEMQAQAIFEATVDAHKKGVQIAPEIMIPVVSAMREVELVKSRIDAIASQVSTARDQKFEYQLGVMVETPRAALRAEDIARHADFLSFGTNDLTQMTYGLSRDDAGRFMTSYVQQGVYAEDPFHTFDIEGVGELLSMGAERGRKGRKNITLSLCGEHGGTRHAIGFCRTQGFDYVSCSPFRVPVARLSAAQLTLEDRWGTNNLREKQPLTT
ncbi:MAG: putative PEP-binding protein [Pseudomonadota bacterium]